MTQFFSSPLAFAAHLVVVERNMRAVEPAIVAKATQMVWEEARRVLGTEGYNWPALSPNTKKTQPGMLLETGELRDSIEWTAHGLHGEVGSNNDKAVWHELGTSRIPPRPFLAGAAAAMGPEIQKKAARAVMAVALGKGLHSSEMMELLHLLKHVGHAVGKVVDKALDGPEGDNARKRR